MIRQLRWYFWIWIAALLFCAYHFWAMNFAPEAALVQGSPAPGRPYSLVLGWVGFGAMVLMNVYTLRKRVGFMKNWGRVPQWLNFHIFCGLLGPTLVVFHTNFKVRGLVSVSFWSMVLVAVSGVLGRYLLLTIARARADLEGGVARVRRLTLEQLQKILGYWHALHLPFAGFMYAVAVLHIASAMLLGIHT